MSDVRIEVFNGPYDNDDAYNRVLGYISNKLYCNGYGFSYDRSFSIIEQFRLSEKYSAYQNDRKIWHFAITFASNLGHTYLLNMASEAALMFASDYQAFFGLDTKKSNGEYSPHLHFAVNAFSYKPQTEPLTKERMFAYMGALKKLLSSRCIGEVTLQFMGKRQWNV